MQNQNLPYVLPINGPNLFMDKKSSMLTLARLHTSTKVALNLSKLSPVLFSVMDKQSTQLFSQLSTCFPSSQRNVE
jgi:hypothetical protein